MHSIANERIAKIEMRKGRENVRNTDLRNHWRQDHTLSQRQQEAWRNKGEGMNRQDAYKMLEMNSYTVFVDNLPMSMTTSWLWQICGFEGRVVDVFLSRKKRASKPFPFAFVRFLNKQDATEAITNLNGLRVRGCSLEVKEARYKRFGEDQNKECSSYEMEYEEDGRKGLWGNRCDGRTFKDVVLQKKKQAERREDLPTCTVNGRARVQKDRDKVEKTIVIYGEVDETMMEKLSRSIIGESVYPVNIEVMGERLRRDWFTIVDVKPMGAYKTLITFENKQDVEDAMGSDFMFRRHSKMDRGRILPDPSGMD